MNGPIPPPGYAFGTNLVAEKIHLMPEGWQSSLCGRYMYKLPRQTVPADEVCQSCARELHRPRMKALL